jgi:hypothetical protein
VKFVRQGGNLRTYSVYHPDSEPAGYWEELQKKKPAPPTQGALSPRFLQGAQRFFADDSPKTMLWRMFQRSVGA